MSQFSMDSLLDRYPHELSIGQRQRAVFLKTISHKPKIVFIDEPTEKETYVILKEIKASYEEYHNVKYSDQILQEIIEKSKLYLVRRSFPDKAIDVMDEIGTRKKSSNKSFSKLIDETLITLAKKINTKFLICAVQRGNEVIIPNGNFKIEKGDRISVTADTQLIAELLKDLGRKDEAITMLGNLLENKPEYYDASLLLGELLCEEERFKEAVSVYQDALRYKPVDFELYYSLGIAYTRLNDFASAKECYEKAADINHKLYGAKYSLAQIALMEEDLDEAEKNFAECLMSEELEAKAYYQLAKIYMVKEEKDKAILFANKAIEIDESYLNIIAKEKIFEPIKEYLTVSVKMEEREIKKPSKRDEEIQKYLEETVGLIKGMNENEMKNRVVQKVDEIFKQEEIKKEKDEQAKENNDIQKEKI